MGNGNGRKCGRSGGEHKAGNRTDGCSRKRMSSGQDSGKRRNGKGSRTMQ